jgi:hypothetical protein
MRRVPTALALALLAGGALVLPGCHASSKAEVPVALGEGDYFAEYTDACGLTLLKVSASESGPFVEVFPVGEEAPHLRLRPHAQVSGRFIVRGATTGVRRSDGHCGTYPVFKVTAFRPWGAVRRCTSPGAADAMLQLYTEELPTDRYAPEDFASGPMPPSLDGESCVPPRGGGCGEGWRRIRDCAGDVVCCRLLPGRAEEAPGQARP